MGRGDKFDTDSQANCIRIIVRGVFLPVNSKHVALSYCKSLRALSRRYVMALYMHEWFN